MDGQESEGSASVTETVRSCKKWIIQSPSKEEYDNFLAQNQRVASQIAKIVDYFENGKYIIHVQFSSQKREAQLKKWFPTCTFEPLEGEHKKHGSKPKVSQEDKELLQKIQQRLFDETLFLDEVAKEVSPQFMIVHMPELQSYVKLLQTSFSLDKYVKMMYEQELTFEELLQRSSLFREKTYLLAHQALLLERINKLRRFQKKDDFQVPRDDVQQETNLIMPKLKKKKKEKTSNIHETEEKGPQHPRNPQWKEEIKEKAPKKEKKSEIQIEENQQKQKLPNARMGGAKKVVPAKDESSGEEDDELINVSGYILTNFKI